MALAQLHGRRYDPAHPDALPEPTLRHTPGGHPHNQLDHAGGRAKAAVRAVLAAATTTDQIARVVRDEYQRITGRDRNKLAVIMDGQSPATAREHAEGVLRGLERFPEVALRFVSVNRDPDDRAYASAADPYDDGRDVRIFFGMAWSTADARARYLRSLKSDARSGWHPPNTGTPTGVALHEFGHGVAFSVDESDLRARMDRVVRRFTGPRQSVSTAVAEVSLYADTSPHELIAEAFADVMVNGDDAAALSKELYGELEAAYKRRYGGPS